MPGHFRLALLGSLLLPAATVGQGVLDDVRREVRQPEPSRSRTPREAAPVDDNDEADSLFGDFLGGLLGSLFSVSFEGMEYEPAPTMRFLDYPYQGNFPGYLSKDLLGSQTYADIWKDRIHQSFWFGRVSLDEGYDFHNEINRANGNILLDTVAGWGVQTNWNILTQRCGCGQTDTLAVGNSNVTYRLLESRRLMVRAGVGANTLADRYGTEWGVNFHMDADWFPRRPIVATSVFDAGTLGSTSLVHIRGTLGFIYRRAELFCGYDWLRIGSTDIHGPLVGIRFWF